MQIYTVQQGDSVYEIARSYGVSSDAIIIANGLNDPARISVGEALVIPQANEVYTVQVGDTLQSISEATGIPLRTLWQYNPILEGGEFIYPGETLVLSIADPPGETIAVNGYAYPFIEPNVLRRTLPYLTYLTVFTYGFDESGNLIEPDDQDIVTLARSYGVTPILLLSSYTEEGFFNNNLTDTLFNDPALQETLLENLRAVMAEKGYGGVDFDFEYVFADNAAAYGSFVERARAYFEPYGFFVVTSLAPKTSAEQPGLLYEGHSYPILGAASDMIALMTYEWGYTFGPPMAVAPIRSVRKVLDYAVSEIPSEKILLGEPNYAYDWTLPYYRGSSAARSLSNVSAVTLAREVGAEILYDSDAQSPYFRYYDAERREHEVWFQDARSVDASLNLVPEYGLRGIGVWNIMRYFPQLWTVLVSRFRIAEADEP